MAHEPITPRDPACLSRRALLTAIGAAGVVASVAACEAEAPSTPPNNAPGSPSVSSSPPPTGGAGQALTTTTAVPVGGGKIVSGVLVVQPTAGRFAAYDARCPHQGARLSPPQAGVVTCYEHNSTFSDVDGALLGGPAPRGLRQVPIAVRGTTISRTT